MTILNQNKWESLLIILFFLLANFNRGVVYGDDNVSESKSSTIGDTTELYNDLENCDSENKCLPNCTLSQIYDENLDSCLSLVGESCKLNEDCVTKSTCNPEWNTKEGVFEGKCHCESKYFEHTNNKTCGRRATYGQECDNLKNPCETTLFMVCKEGTCQCDNNDTHIYDPIKKSCAIRTGTGCYNYRTLPWYLPCVQNAECKYFFTKRNAVKCKCAKGYIETSEGFCRASFGKVCNSTSVCHSSGNLVCSDGKCQCDSPISLVFDANINKCAGIIGTGCSSGEECISTAFCDEATSKCKCQNSYSETKEHLCELTFDQKCNISQFQCNSHMGLTCKNGLCKCFDSSLEFDTQLQYCKVKEIGSPCGTFNNEAKAQRRFHAQCDSPMTCMKKFTFEKEEQCHCQVVPHNITITENSLCMDHYGT